MTDNEIYRAVRIQIEEEESPEMNEALNELRSQYVDNINNEYWSYRDALCKIASDHGVEYARLAALTQRLSSAKRSNQSKIKSDIKSKIKSNIKLRSSQLFKVMQDQKIETDRIDDLWTFQCPQSLREEKWLKAFELLDDLERNNFLIGTKEFEDSCSELLD